MNDPTQILAQIESGDRCLTEQLLPRVYAQLRRMAAAKLAQEKPGQTLQATDLVHEAYLRLVVNPSERGWDSRGHFFSAAAQAMRRILVENARRKSRQKRGGANHRVPLREDDLISEVPPTEILALDEALDCLEAEAPEQAQLVKLRYFAGLTLEEAAAALGVSRATAARYWTYARVWLYDRLQG